ncbi:MAG: thiamine-monophosphate kinase [Gaiellales bacterium]|jgi:thiamine-monophosphate kinase
MLPEDDQVELIAQVAGAGPGVLVGIGDDAAVLAGGVLVSSDMLVDGVHFDRSRLSPRQIGHRAAGANLSDLAAMGGAPTCLIASFGIPVGFHDVQELAAGLADHGVPLAGGDLVRSPVLVVSVTVVGHADTPVRRDGGIPGDVLIVSGPLGGQAASGYTLPVTPRLAEGALLAKTARAMIDISDGIATDVRRLARACGTGALIELERLPLGPGASVEQAAAGGEDYELLAAVPPHAPLPGWATVVGRLTADPQVVLIDADGRDRDDLQGHDHFR